MPRPDADARRQPVDVGVVEGTVRNQAQGPGNRVERSSPEHEVRRDLGAAAQARAEPRALGRGGTGQEDAVVQLRRSRRTHRPAVHAGAPHAGEEATVEPRIARPECPIACLPINQHGHILMHHTGNTRQIRPCICRSASALTQHPAGRGAGPTRRPARASRPALRWDIHAVFRKEHLRPRPRAAAAAAGTARALVRPLLRCPDQQPGGCLCVSSVFVQ